MSLAISSRPGFRLAEVTSKIRDMPTPFIPEKLQFSGHETFPLRQLWLRKAYIAVRGANGNSAESKKVFADDAAIRRFGVGKNMVASIRHWALACDVLAEGDGGSIELGSIGDLLFGVNGVDQYLEKPATCWLVHWLLAGRGHRSTTWFWVFNRVTHQSFDRSSIVRDLESLVAQRGYRVSSNTLKRDVEVCLRCYLPRHEGNESDDSAEPLLTDLALITESKSGILQFSRGAQKTLPDAVFAYALTEYWRRWERSADASQKTLSFESIAHDYGSPGRVFKLDESSVSDRLSNLEEVTNGAIRWTDSAGIRQVSRFVDDIGHEFQMNLLRNGYGR
jgi:hypothetical protein